MKSKVILLLIISFLFSCNSSNPVVQKQLLIYCGITMENPVREISLIFEKQENCKVLLIKGASEDLYNSMVKTKTGDIYVPGSESFVKKGFLHKVLIDTVFVGTNKAVIMIKKGNPKKIKNDLKELTNENLRVILGNPFTGSIGDETKKILIAEGIYEEVINNTLSFTIDSKDLIPAIKDNNADLTINWYATYTWSDNAKHVDVFELEENIAPNHKIYICLSKFTNEIELAEKFIKMAGSEKSKAIFQKYGF